jgi:hypothetical protein
MSASTLLNSKAIAEVAAGSASALRKFDRHGLFPAPGENHQQFANRLSRLAAALDELKKNLEQNGSVEPCSGIKLQKNSAIPGNITGEALEKTCRLYDVKPDWVPGFFADESFGMLWGGCALSDPASNLVLFIIRKVFLKKRKFLVYDRQELMAHELTHAAHQSIDEIKYEEYFAYRTAQSALRRFSGGCFIYKHDALCFLLPILLLPIVQFLNIFTALALPMNLFYVLAAIYPAFLIWRCFATWRTAGKARKILQKNHVAAPDAVLFRMTAAEISALAHGKLIQGNDLRWSLIKARVEKKG